MDLKTYFFDTLLTPDDRDSFARKCGTTKGHMQNVAYGYRKPSPELAVAVERVSEKKVTRREMYPETFAGIWPELAPATTGA